jgi:hypothetical protein
MEGKYKVIIFNYSDYEIVVRYPQHPEFIKRLEEDE